MEPTSSPLSGQSENLTIRFNHSFQTPKISQKSDHTTGSTNILEEKGVPQEPRVHHTLGQMAEQFQERARAIRMKGSGFENSEDEGPLNLGDESDDDHGSNAHSESTGRWTKHEHELFLEALKKYGKEWKKVASMVKTRTVVQTRTHAQKYFQKLAKAMGNGDSFPPQEVLEKGDIRPSGQKRVIRKSLNQAEYATPETQMDRMREFSGKMKELSRSYFPLESEELRPHTVQATPPTFDLPSIYIPPPSRQDFPQPSPAACGKRKQAELAAAQILAGSSALEIEGASVLSAMKRDVDDSKAENKRARPLNLSIAFPEKIQTFDSEPGTPWESELKAFTAKTLPIISASTPSEQRNLQEQLRKMIRHGDVSKAQELLQAIQISLSTATSAIDVSPSNTSFHRSNATSKVINYKKDGEVPVLIENVRDASDEKIAYEFSKLLLDCGAQPNAVDDRGSTALHFAAMKGYEKVGRLLLNRGCPANAVNEDGNAAVHLASKYGHVSVLEMLAGLGANFHLRNHDALAPLDLAASVSRDPGEREMLRKRMFTVEPRLRSLILYHQDFLDHTALRPSDWEGPDRLSAIMTRLQDRLLFPDYEVEFSSQFEKADVSLLGRVHSADYLEFVNELSKRVQSEKKNVQAGPVPFTPQVQRHLMRQPSEEIKKLESCDTSFSSGTLNASRRAAGAVAHAVDRVLLGRNRNAFCAIRPPGHHAGYRGLLDGGTSCGFCIFNNVAVGALHAIEDHHCERVAIVDLDIHHGNGTEDIVRRFKYPSRLFFFSIHLFDSDSSIGYQFYPGTGAGDDYVHNIINVPISPIWKFSKPQEKRTKSGVQQEKDQANRKPNNLEETKQLCGREAFRQAILQRLIPSLRAFNPSLILLSSGFDAADGDVGNCRHLPNVTPIRGMDLKLEDFSWATTEIMKIADICCNGRLISVLEGGYGEYQGEPEVKNVKVTTRQQSSAEVPEIDAHAMERGMSRNILAEAVAAHVHRLIDPYGPSRLPSTQPQL